MTTATWARAERIAGELVETFQRDLQRQANKCIVCGAVVHWPAPMWVQPLTIGSATVLATFTLCGHCHAHLQRPGLAGQALRLRIRDHIGRAVVGGDDGHVTATV